MSKIVLATIGSLGDLHPKIALGLELRSRGHDVSIAAMEYYREKIENAGLGFSPMAPHLEPNDLDLARELMDAEKGSEKILRGLIMPNLRAMYNELLDAVSGSDLLITGEIVWAAKSVIEKTGIKWISTSLAPISFFSAFDPPVPPTVPWTENLRFLGVNFHRAFIGLARKRIKSWYGPYREFRRELGLSEDHDPLFSGKYSKTLHLALYSRVLGHPQPDWPPATLQAGFCFYDQSEDAAEMPEELSAFLAKGDRPIVFTLGSAAVMDARDFFDIGIETAKRLDRRAVVLYGRDMPRPKNLDDNIAAFEYAPYSLVFPQAVCIVHQGGAGTTGQALRAGVPQLIMPFSHDQPDNAARCRRLGVAEILPRERYTTETATAAIRKIIWNRRYSPKAAEAAAIVRRENGTRTACDAIEAILCARLQTIE